MTEPDDSNPRAKCAAISSDEYGPLTCDLPDGHPRHSAGAYDIQPVLGYHIGERMRTDEYLKFAGAKAYHRFKDDRERPVCWAELMAYRRREDSPGNYDSVPYGVVRGRMPASLRNPDRYDRYIVALDARYGPTFDDDTTRKYRIVWQGIRDGKTLKAAAMAAGYSASAGSSARAKASDYVSHLRGRRERIRRENRLARYRQRPVDQWALSSVGVDVSTAPELKSCATVGDVVHSLGSVAVWHDGYEPVMDDLDGIGIDTATWRAALAQARARDVADALADVERRLSKAKQQAARRIAKLERERQRLSQELHDGHDCRHHPRP